MIHTTGGGLIQDQVAAGIRADVERLCALGDRNLGTKRNRAATDYVTKRLREARVDVESIEFEVPAWCFRGASVRTADIELEVHPGPFSTTIAGKGPLVVVRRAEELSAVDTPGAVLLLCDEIAATQFTPRDYPFYGDPEHAAILDALEAAHPLAVLAATDKSAMTGAMSPFPLIEEVRFSVSSAYMTAEQGTELARRAGEVTSVSIDSEVRPSSGSQPYGRRIGTSEGRIVVSAHIDSKPGTPGAIDNASGVAVMLAAAGLLGEAASSCTIEFVPYNGEDHALAPGEVAWLAANEDLSDVKLAVNIDGSGLPGAPSAYSLYDVDEETTAVIDSLSANHASVAEGPQWPAGDHMIFAMRGIPAVAVTSTDFEAVSGEYAHTPEDVPEILDYELLADTARFIAAVIATMYASQSNG